MHRIQRLAAAGVLVAFSVGAAGQERPNIVFMLADDMGYGDVGCYNAQSKIPTPHMDRLAAEGMRFTDAHSSSSVCTPSRYGILTGRYCWRTSLKRSVHFNYEPPLIEMSRLTVASMLKTEGYRTACVGKWHLGLGYSAKEGQVFDFDRPQPWPGGMLPKTEEMKIDFSKPLKGGPITLGFDLFYGTSACSTCNVPYGLIEGDRFIEQPTEYYEGKYLEQRSGWKAPGWNDEQADMLFLKKGVEFIQESAESGEPFFLYLPASTPHEPCEPEVIPEFMRGASEAGPRGDMVALFDYMVGEVMNALDEAGVADNTLLIVTSDNGAKPGSYNRLTHGHQSCGYLRGFKSSTWEGGHRVPMIVRWPAVVKLNTVSHQLVGLQDFMATVADVLDLAIPENAAEDSISFLPALNGVEQSESARSNLMHHSALGVFAIRQGPWKLIIDCDNSGGVKVFHQFGADEGTGPQPHMESQLYHLVDDPFEVYNRIEDNAEIAADLRRLAEAQQQSARSAPLPN